MCLRSGGWGVCGATAPSPGPHALHASAARPGGSPSLTVHYHPGHSRHPAHTLGTPPQCMVHLVDHTGRHKRAAPASVTQGLPAAGKEHSGLRATGRSGMTPPTPPRQSKGRSGLPARREQGAPMHTQRVQTWDCRYAAGAAWPARWANTAAVLPSCFCWQEEGGAVGVTGGGGFALAAGGRADADDKRDGIGVCERNSGGKGTTGTFDATHKH